MRRLQNRFLHSLRQAVTFSKSQPVAAGVVTADPRGCSACRPQSKMRRL